METDSFSYDRICKRCRGTMITDGVTGERFCRNCGFVVEEQIQESGPERNTSKDERDDKTRVGMPTSLAIHDMGLATTIGAVNKDASGKPLSSQAKHEMKRLRIWDSRSQMSEHGDRNLRYAFTQLDKLKDKLGSAVIVLSVAEGSKVSLVAGVTADLTGKVKAGELVVEIETDKAVVEVEATATGKIAQILEQAGTVVKMGQQIAVVSPA